MVIHRYHNNRPESLICSRLHSGQWTIAAAMTTTADIIVVRRGYQRNRIRTLLMTPSACVNVCTWPEEACCSPVTGTSSWASWEMPSPPPLSQYVMREFSFPSMQSLSTDRRALRLLFLASTTAGLGSVRLLMISAGHLSLIEKEEFFGSLRLVYVGYFWLSQGHGHGRSSSALRRVSLWASGSPWNIILSLTLLHWRSSNSFAISKLSFWSSSVRCLRLFTSILSEALSAFSVSMSELLSSTEAFSSLTSASLRSRGSSFSSWCFISDRVVQVTWAQLTPVALAVWFSAPWHIVLLVIICVNAGFHTFYRLVDRWKKLFQTTVRQGI